MAASGGTPACRISATSAAAAAPAGCHGLLYLPYLRGERCPVDDPPARACFAVRDLPAGAKVEIEAIDAVCEAKL